MAVSPNHHDDTRKHHRDRKNLPHADVLHPAAGELGVGLAEEFHDDAEQAVANQEQTGNGAGRARFTDMRGRLTTLSENSAKIRL